MALGILRIAAVLENSGYQVEMLDLSGIENYETAIVDHAKNTSTKIFGITATTPQMPAVARIQQRLRNTRPDAKIILGGPHPTLVNAAAKKEKAQEIEGRAQRALTVMLEQFDVVVAGDGEKAIFQAIEENAPPLIDADNPQSELFLKDKDLENLPFPARHLVDVSSYNYEIDKTPALSLIAQLGCPFGCGFCGGRKSPMLRRIRKRLSESVVEEIRHLYLNYGVEGFMFYDDELNVNREMVGLMDGIAELQKELEVEFRLRGFIKSELFDERQAEAMYKAGFRWILTGFESGSHRILENINKRATREDNSRCVQIAHDNGLKVKGLMSIGHPGESEQTAYETLDWLLEAKPDDFDVSIITTYPGTPYYDEAKPHENTPGIWVYRQPKTGDKLYAVELDYNLVSDYYKGDPDGGYQAFVYTDELSSEELVKWRDKIERTARKNLDIAFNEATPAIRYEHSMGQFGGRHPELLPDHILRTSKRQESAGP